MRHIRCTTLPWAAGLALFVSSSHTVPGALALDTLDPLFSVSGNLSVDAAGDVNNDGTPDVISGDSSAGGSFRGKAWVTSGADGTNLYTFEPPPGMTLAFLGHSVAGIDDLNGDDHADVVVSMYAENTVFIYSGFDGEVLETLKQDSGGFGFTLANAGDVNNDDINDLIVGDQHGRAFLYSGADRSLLHTWETGESEVAVDGAGDVNRDGHDDIILGLSHHSRIDRNRGRIEVYSGSDYRRIYAFDGGRQDEFFGHDVDTAGDLNFDGHADFIAGSLYAGVVRVYSGIDGDEL